MGIIEKLGITPMKKIVVTDGVHIVGIAVYPNRKVEELEQQRNEMINKMGEQIGNIKNATPYWKDICLCWFELLAIATGKTWEEIKELLNE